DCSVCPKRISYFDVVSAFADGAIPSKRGRVSRPSEQTLQPVSEEGDGGNPDADPEHRETDFLQITDGKGSHQLHGWRLTCQQFQSLFTKRFLYARRSRRGLFAQIVLPALFVFVALLFSLIVPPFGKYPALELQPWMYEEQFTFISEDVPEEASTKRLISALLNNPGFGTKCMKDRPEDTPCEGSGSDWAPPPLAPALMDMLLNGNWTAEFPSPGCECSSKNNKRMLPECSAGAGGMPPPQVGLPARLPPTCP
uniref:ATP-binding cassette sub-family A member 1-like n=1 Tax=Callorhinchus milii TaxID=7868 RepID=A0A4W3GNW6_CALMI